jgi:protein-disulfide isomerase
MRSRAWILGVLVGAGCFGCDQGAGGKLDEVAKGQKEILAKIEALEKTVNQIKAAPAAAARPQADPNKVYTIPVDGNAMRGPKTAKVTIVEFSDFQCPFCVQSKALIDEVLQAYPKDVRFVYKQFPLTTIHPLAMGAAKAALVAQKSGKFWEMHDLMFANSRELQPEKLKEYAAKIGLDAAKFEKDLNAPEAQQAVEKEMAEARAADVQGTPTFFVNGKRLMTRSVDGFKQAIDQALKAG